MKARMNISLKPMAHQILIMVEKWYSTPTITIEGVQVPKSKQNWGKNETKKESLNVKAMNALFALLVPMNLIGPVIAPRPRNLEYFKGSTRWLKSSEKSKSISSYTKMNYIKWRMMNQSKICFFCFTYIVNGSKLLGKVYPNVNLANRIHRSLPKSWEPNVTAIQKVGDLKTLPLDDLVSYFDYTRDDAIGGCKQKNAVHSKPQPKVTKSLMMKKWF